MLINLDIAFNMAVIEIGQFLQDFSIIMIVAGAIAMLSSRFKKPMVIGYIGAGMIVGVLLLPLVLFSILMFLSYSQ